MWKLRDSIVVAILVGGIFACGMMSLQQPTVKLIRRGQPTTMNYRWHDKNGKEHEKRAEVLVVWYDWEITNPQSIPKEVNDQISKQFGGYSELSNTGEEYSPERDGDDNYDPAKGKY